MISARTRLSLNEPELDNINCLYILCVCDYVRIECDCVRIEECCCAGKYYLYDCV